MIVSKQKPFAEILAALGEAGRIFLVGCAKCATVCKAGGEEQIWQMQELLAAAGKEVTGSIVIDEACHLLRVQRDLRGKGEPVRHAEALLVLACGAGVQSVSAAVEQRTVAGLDTLFLGNIRRFGHFEQRCSLCGECLLNETAGICPVTVCPKGMLNGPCGGMDEGKCEVNAEAECVWSQIYSRLKARGEFAPLIRTTPAKDFSKMRKPGSLKLER
ncbi:5,10-methylenetetrahydrofolate reductase-associated protein [Geotalea uraniireducens]|uniref:5,10-methylenetetrahydrofolate reductase-associated protein n=1 Tax=Geotalea uraniireducens TaxID=351604 RepID=A0ABN6VQF7_9BACT|nr:methylenetetrahydrofolate reductase C-terminal domain-containing protein [Geotalea uraniireducens]BDV42239.1 5,10-methylenetetrahydrofolate reductase-associated protein [Geotalea uraniireducens]